MLVVEHMNCILETMRDKFKQNRIFKLFKSHLVSNLEMPGRHTISNVICFKGDDNKDWTREYRLFSTSIWDVKSCMNIILLEGINHLPELPFIPIAVDLTTLRKQGKKIPFTNYQVDPLSPPFRKGLMWGQRFLHASLLIPMEQYSLPARGVPVRLEISPFVKKPGKKASEEDWKEYKKAKKSHNANVQAMKLIKELREVCSQKTFKKLLVVGDGGFCNRQCFGPLPEGVDLLVRCRKDATLCRKSKEKGSFYSKEKFTPDEIRKAPNVPYQEAKAFYGGNWRNIEYKEVKDVYWQRGAQKKPLRTIVIKPMPYRKTSSGNDNYRDPCYLLTTDLTTPAELLIQMYFNRIEIEQNHRDMKNSLGLGQAQVWSEVSVERQPQTVMLGYSILLLSTLKGLGTNRKADDYLPPPKWYRGRLRPTIEDMRRRLRQELNSYPEQREKYGICIPWGHATTKLVA
jgi:hypothetical protein